jgi:pimeloyl-ACP methyl ester carboxylesterase
MTPFSVPRDGGQMAGLHFGDAQASPRLVFIHATGFNGQTYAPILSEVAKHVPTTCLDMRGHGRTRLPSDPRKLTGWHTFRDDLIATLEQIAPEGVWLAGHSMGATVSLLTAAARPDLVNGLILFDPVILPARMGLYARLPGAVDLLAATFPLAKQARRRRRHFDSPDAAIRSFSGRGAFKTWASGFSEGPRFVEGFVEGYVDAGLVEAADGGFDLACDPAWEQRCYAAQAHDAWGALKRYTGPVSFHLGQTYSTCPPFIARRIARACPQSSLVRWDGTGHFLPLEAPDRTVEALIAPFKSA